MRALKVNRKGYLRQKYYLGIRSGAGLYSKPGVNSLNLINNDKTGSCNYQ